MAITTGGYTVETNESGGVHTVVHAESAAQRTALLAALNALGSQTTLAAVLAKLSADPATQTTLAAVLAKLSADPATQTTLAAVLAKLSADPATQTTSAAILAKLSADPATQTTLALVKTAVELINTNLGEVTASPTGNSVLGRLKSIAAAIAAGPVLPDPISLGSNLTATGAWVGPLAGGEYIWTARSGAWNGTTASLEDRADDGVTGIPTGAVLLANGSKLFKIGQGSYVRNALAGGTTTGVTSSLSKVS